MKRATRPDELERYDQRVELIAKSGAVTAKQVLSAVQSREQETKSKCTVRLPRGSCSLRVWILDSLSDMGWNIKPEDAEVSPKVE